MNVVDQLTRQNEAFSASDHFNGGLRIIPSKKIMLIGCVDPRVDPEQLFGLAPGEAAVFRNIGGRVTPATLQTLKMLRTVAKTGGGEMGAGWNLIVLHHTDCGIRALAHSPDLAAHFGVGVEDLEGLAISDPYASVAIDIAKLRADPDIPGGFTVSGVVYDVKTGLTKIVVPAAILREE